MKKLALALVCLVSVAFFASCTPEGQPTIQVLAEEGYVVDNQVVDLNTDLNYGFVMASSAETNKDLKQLVVKIDDGEETVVDLTGMKEYTFRDVIKYTLEAKDIIAESMITATVTDVAGQTATATITLSINEEQPLFGTTIEWVRKGTNVLSAEEMAGYGLKWTGSYKDVMATLEPIEGATLYVCNGDDYETIGTMTEKAAYFANLAETATPAQNYRNITTNNSANYNDMLAVVNGENTYLIHITRAEIETGNYGTQITIKGEAK